MRNTLTKMKSNRRPTVKDLAKATGYSQGAISRAFNGRSGISEATREKILRTAREIGYHPNPSARNFKRGYTGRVGIILPNLRNTNYSELYEHLDDVLAEAGLASALSLSQAVGEREARTILHWSAGETDALVLNPMPNSQNLELYRKLKSWRYPLVMIYSGVGVEFDSLCVDYLQSLRQVVGYLRDVGHKKVAYVGISSWPKPYGKLAVLLDVLRECGMGYDEELSLHHAQGPEAGSLAFSKWLVLNKRPTAVVAYNDQTAASIYSEARRVGVRIPEDMSLLGSDDVDQAKTFGLSTIRVDRVEMARTLYAMLKNRMEDFDSPIRIQRLPAELVMRYTLGPSRAPQART